MALASLLEEERELIEAVLEFANRKVRSTEEVERRFAKLSLVPGYFKRIESGKKGIETYEGDRTELRGWLARIDGGISGRADVAKEVAARLARTVPAQVIFSDERIRYIYGVDGVEAVRALGVALILDKGKRLTNRLLQCKNPKCGKFNLDFEPKGRPRRFCNAKCKLAWDKVDGVERTRRYRKKVRSQRPQDL